SGRPSPRRDHRSRCRGSPSRRRVARPAGSARSDACSFRSGLGRAAKHFGGCTVETWGQPGRVEGRRYLLHLRDPAPALGPRRAGCSFGALGQVRQRQSPLLLEGLLDTLGTSELTDREQQCRRSLRPRRVRRLQRGRRPDFAGDDASVEKGSREQRGHRLGRRAGEVEPRRPVLARRRADDPTVDAVPASGDDDALDLAGGGRGNRVGFDEQAPKARDRTGDLERRVRRADGEDDLASAHELLERACVLEPRRLGAAPGITAAPDGGPEDAVSVAAQHGPDRGSHLAGMQEPDRRGSHYTGTLTIVWLGGQEMTEREQEFLDYVQGGGQVETEDWMPDDYRAKLIKFIEMHGNSELMGVLPEREWILRSPTLQRKLALTAKVQDEVGHSQLIYRVVEDLGKPREQCLDDLISGKSKFHNVFHYPTKTWGDVGVIAWLVDAAAIISQKALLKCSYAPYARIMKKICWEESFHILHGRDVILTMMLGTDDQRELVQEALDRWWGPLMQFHGNPIPREDDPMYVWRIKSQGNEEARQQFLDGYVPQIWELGLTVPDPKLRKRGDGVWEFAEPDWDELKHVVTGHGPQTAERLELRRTTREENAWVRRTVLAEAA